jgi:N utilization substance protein A
MDIVLKNEDMRCIAVAENYAKTRIIDCINDGQRLMFVVEKGRLGKAIGRNAKNLNQLQKVFRKDVKLIEFDDDVEKFVRNLFKPYVLTSIELKDDTVIVMVNPQDKGKAIGKNGCNIKLLRELAKRHHAIKQLKVL